MQGRFPHQVASIEPKNSISQIEPKNSKMVRLLLRNNKKFQKTVKNQKVRLFREPKVFL